MAVGKKKHKCRLCQLVDATLCQLVGRWTWPWEKKHKCRLCQLVGRRASWRPPGLGDATPVGGTQRNASWRDATQRQLAVGGPKISKSDWAQSAGFCTIRQAHLLWEIGKKVRARPFPTVKIYILIGIVQRNCFSANIPSTEAGGYV